MKRLVRRIVAAAIALVIAGVVTSTFLIDGWLVPIVVSSGSMAPALLGPHRMARCQDCAFEFACDADDVPDDQTAVCPNCGRRGNPIEPQIVRGDRLFIDRASYAWRRPRRWEVVVFRSPEFPGDYAVKRVVGLPGELIDIRNGHAYVNGQIARRTLAEQRAMAVLVNDSAFPTRNSTRWGQPVPAVTTGRARIAADSKWLADGDGWKCDARHELRGGTLTYAHWRRVAGSPDKVEFSPILDEDSYNQAESRQLNEVTDLMLVAQLSTRGHGQLTLTVSDRLGMYRHEHRIAIEPESGQIGVDVTREPPHTATAAAHLFAQPTELVLSLADHQVLLAIGGKTVLAYPYEPSGAPPVWENVAPFAISAENLDVQISRLQVWRDVYYTPPVNAQTPTARQLGPDEYFVLGDNSPVSKDSRSWTGGDVVPASLIVGRSMTFSHRGP